MHRPRTTSGCQPAHKAPGTCPKATGKGETLADLIREYKREYGDRQLADREQFRGFTNLTEAIKWAARSVGTADMQCRDARP